MGSEGVSPSTAALGAFASPEVVARIDKMKTFATPDVPALASDKAAWAMAWLHLVVWNSWKAAYVFADKYTPGDFESYRSYAAYSVDFLIDHHHAEEASLFPEVEKKVPGSMEINEAQHREFLDPLVDLSKYLKTTNESQFDGKVVRAKFDALLLPVMSHLAEELDTLEGSQLRSHFSEAECAHLSKTLHKASQGPATLSLPFILQNLPPGAPFPPAPRFVTRLLGPSVFWWKNRSMWKYCAWPFKQELAVTVPA